MDFILVFGQHSDAMRSKMKGNVDTVIRFSVMKRLYKKKSFDQIVLVSGDGDFKSISISSLRRGEQRKYCFQGASVALRSIGV